MDVLRGLSLLSIFVDHIPHNRLADFTLHTLGFCDAAELFVILAGFSAMTAYTQVFERAGLRVGLLKVLSRCLQIYGVQVGLLLITMLFVSLWQHLSGQDSVILGPLLRDGWRGAVRGLTLKALPAYLDILPLYIVLLALFPFIRFGMARHVGLTIGASALVYVGANLWQWNLPNVVDRNAAAHWYFDPFTWQFIFVLGCALATEMRRGASFLTSPPMWLTVPALLYSLAALITVDAWKLWPAPLGDSPDAVTLAITILGNEPKTYVSPFRLLNVLAWVYLVVTTPGLIRVARSKLLWPINACGRHSLYVFAAGCVFALLGRLAFRIYGVTVEAQVLINGLGLGLLLVLGLWLERRKQARALSRDLGDGDHVRRAAE